MSAAGLWQLWAGECEAASPGYSDGFRNSARFNQPQGMCIHPRGQLLVADKGNHCIRQVTADGALQLVTNNFAFKFARRQYAHNMSVNVVCRDCGTTHCQACCPSMYIAQ